MGSSWGLLRLKVDDPLDAFPVHGCCGLFGVLLHQILWLLSSALSNAAELQPVPYSCLSSLQVLAVGIFGTDENVAVAYGHENDAIARGEQFGVQFIAALAIIAWTVVFPISYCNQWFTASTHRPFTVVLPMFPLLGSSAIFSPTPASAGHVWFDVFCNQQDHWYASLEGVEMKGAD